MSAAAMFLEDKLGPDPPRVAIVLGSGLGALADAVDEPTRVPYAAIPGFPDTPVAGHGGELVIGRMEGVRVMLQSGRFHLYEGHHPRTIATPIRAFADLGVDTLVVTNAAGGIRPTFQPPLLMLIADQLNLMWRNPLVGPLAEGEDRFPDMSDPYDRGLRQTARRVALHIGVGLEEGVYAGVLGPGYETPAEIRMLAQLGADAVGMSTVPEVIAARARGMRVIGISTITNLAAGISPAKLDHADVLAAGARMKDPLEQLVRGIVREV